MTVHAHGDFQVMYELRDFINGDRVYGSVYNVDRYVARYHVFKYVYHSEYRAFSIYRAYDGTQAKAMYRAVNSLDNVIAVGGSLNEVKAQVRFFIEDREQGVFE